jgi:MerR family mercuric resistance operon transcriptional regulator
MSTQSLTIGKLAKAAGVNVETIRFYQRRGLLPEPKKPLGGIRYYTDAEIFRINFIKSAQRLGFTLEEVTLLLKLEDGANCNEARVIAEQKLVHVRKKIADLVSIEAALAELVGKCDSSRGNVCCPLIDALQHAPVAID